MGGFTALNVEREDDDAEEVDDTTEIQLEEAFRLYNNALKLHAQGALEEASVAFQELFQSDIFKDPEYYSEFRRDKEDEGLDHLVSQAEIAATSLVPTGGGDATASSVPQFLHLSHKSRGQFLLDYIHQTAHGALLAPPEKWQSVVAEVFRDWGPALEFDDTDLDLWKRAARVGAVLPGCRLPRFCLESVLAGDDDSGAAIDLSGLDEAYAAGELEELLQGLEDDLSSRRRVGERPKQALLKKLKKYNDPFPYLPRQPLALPGTDGHRQAVLFQPARHEISPGSRSWLAVGQSLLQLLTGEQQGDVDLGPGAAVTISLPESRSDRAIQPTHVDTPTDLQKSAGSAGITTEVVSDKSTVQSPPDEVRQMAQPVDAVEPENRPDGPDVKIDGGVDEHDHRADAVQLPTRKRSSTMAGNDEPAEARTKSKRLRARESLLENGPLDEEVVPDMTQFYQDQLRPYTSADEAMFANLLHFLTRMGIDGPDWAKVMQQRRGREAVPTPPADDADANAHVLAVLLVDLQGSLDVWTDDKSLAITQGHGHQDFGGEQTGLTLFLQHSKSAIHNSKELGEARLDTGLSEFVHEVNAGWSTIHEVSLAWLERLLCSDRSSASPSASPYMRGKWSDEMKQAVVHLVVCEDSYIYATLQGRSSDDLRSLELVQTLFELHLDIYSSITNPSSQVDVVTQVQQRDRLHRWATLAAQYMNTAPSIDDASLNETDLVLRFIWASTSVANKSEDASRDHVLLCLQDLQLLSSSTEERTILLPNNVAMPEISAAAVQQEISRLSTLDFFMSVFDNSASDPIAVIERLEPILEPVDGVESEIITGTDDTVGLADPSQEQKLVAFLDSGDASLKLYLWRRLRDAYSAIAYVPKVVSCNLRAIEAIVRHLKSARHQRTPDGPRQISLLKWIRDADELVAKLLLKVLPDGNPFECMDQQHLRSSITAVAELCTILYGYIMNEDAVRVGLYVPAPVKTAASSRSFEKSKDRLRETIVRAWTLLYTLLREATVQFRLPSEAAAADLAQCLHVVHNALGNRHYCRQSNKVLLRLIKAEFMSRGSGFCYDDEISQVSYDLYGLSFIAGVGTVDHGCPHEALDKQTAVQMVEVVMRQVSQINIRDLVKTELKNTIDKIQQALGPLKSSPPLPYNKRVISAFLKSPINPKDLYRGVQGVGELATKPVGGDSAAIAAHGWYALLGKITLARFKSVKRVSPTPTDDLDVAAAFFRQDLEHNAESWESWYRLAQVYDAKVEDDLLWNITKVTDHPSDFGTLQRYAIHAYSMAMITVIRSGDDSPQTLQTTADIFADFALRLYASSREPLAMQAFQLDNVVRHFSREGEGTMYQAPPYKPMSLYAVWNFAAYLLRRKFVGIAKPWTGYYTLGKCLWKMYFAPENARMHRPVSGEEVLEAFTEAIEALPARKEKTTEYILEPHFKLVSVVHKMVQRKTLGPAQGVQYLQATPYARKVHLSEDENGPEWEPYILEVLKTLGHADRSNWHHRIIARSAHVLYDESRTLAGALGAKHEFTQQIFTKTMTMQVWKPEHERAGRHYVYTTRYVSFFVTLLSQLKDRSNLDLLLRRVRRKPTEFLNHQRLWEEITTAYAGLLRRVGNIPEGHEKAVLDGLSYEEFQTRADMVEKWAHDPDVNSLLLDVLRDAIELKKLNNGLMKGTMLDELVADTYASIYETFVAQLPPDDPAPPPPPQASANQPGPPPPSTIPTWDPMRVGNMLGPQIDGNTDTSTIRSPIGLGLGFPHTSVVLSSTPPPTGPMVKSTRTKQITKREIIRKAESAILKPPPIKTPILVSKKPVVEICADKPSRDLVATMEESNVSSRQGSVHDSADDESERESEVSDIGGDVDVDDGEKKARAIFPGLVVARRDDDQSSTADGDGGEEEDFHDAIEGPAEPNSNGVQATGEVRRIGAIFE